MVVGGWAKAGEEGAEAAMHLDEARPIHLTPVRFFPDSQYLLEPAFGVWVLECGC